MVPFPRRFATADGFLAAIEVLFLPLFVARAECALPVDFFFALIWALTFRVARATVAFAEPSIAPMPSALGKRSMTSASNVSIFFNLLRAFFDFMSILPPHNYDNALNQALAAADTAMTAAAVPR
jgi:hypothetical protein